MIIATMTELELRMLTKRPTVARTSEMGIWLSASSPTRASDPRTEITRPKDVTINEPGKSKGFAPDYAWPSLDKRLSGRCGRFVKSATISPMEFVPIAHLPAETAGKDCNSGPLEPKAIKEYFTIRPVSPPFGRRGRRAGHHSIQTDV